MHRHNHQLVCQRRLLNRYRHHYLGAADVSDLQIEDTIETENCLDDCVCPWCLVSPEYLGAAANMSI